MEIIERTNDWTLYKDTDGYYLNSRCGWGAVEPTAEFKLLPSEIEHYIENGNSIIHELSRQSDSPSGKKYFEQKRPISSDKKSEMYLCHKI